MDAIDEFFAAFVEFDYNRSASSPREFYRMCDQFGWRKDVDGEYPAERVEAHGRFKVAMTQAFNDKFGTDVDNKRSWENICTLLAIDPLPTRVKDMRRAVKSTHVNLSDLLDSSRTGDTVQIFDTEEELAVYTLQKGRIFPKEDAYAGGLLRYLLREITGTYQGKKRSGRKKARSQR